VPGAPHMRGGRPIAERSAAQIVWLFIVLPVLAGVGILCHLVWIVTVGGSRFTAADWFWQVGWYGLLGLGVMTALPAAGCQELRRRKRAREASAAQPGHRPRPAQPGATADGGD
jgi:hypothetical protein